MPELPEVETIRLSLSKKITGKIIKDIEIRVKKQFLGDPEKILNKKIAGITRKGKVLTLKIGDSYLNIHLKLTGQLLYAGNRNNSSFNVEIPHAKSHKLPAKTTNIILNFKDGSALYFNDLRKFGWMRLSTQPEISSSVDVIADGFTLALFKNAVLKSKKPIKNLLLEQDNFAGIGNIYANDSLWLAHIHPLRKSYTLSDVEVGELYKAIKTIIAEAITRHGSSDESYVTPDNTKGDYQNYFKVYHHEGLPCLRCGSIITRIKHSGRSSFFCPRCQKISYS